MTATKEFRFAPLDWTPDRAREAARAEHLTLQDDHWDLVRGLQEFYARHTTRPVSLRELRDALDEKFRHKGGIKYLYTLFPGGPIAQGCRLAGLKPPTGAIDRGFGSVA